MCLLLLEEVVSKADPELERILVKSGPSVARPVPRPEPSATRPEPARSLIVQFSASVQLQLPIKLLEPLMKKMNLIYMT